MTGFTDKKNYIQPWSDDVGMIRDEKGVPVNCRTCGSKWFSERGRHTVAHGETSAQYHCQQCGRFFHSRGDGDRPLWPEDL